jgi:hypothetical protein
LAFNLLASLMGHQRENFLSSKSCGGTQSLPEDCVRTPLIGALALTLVGCSRQPPSQMAETSCASPNPFACFMAVGLPMPIEISFRSNSARPAAARDKADARAEMTTRPRKSPGPNHNSRYREFVARPKTPATKARHTTCRASSATTPCTLYIPVCSATADQRGSCTPGTPAFLGKWRPLSA